MIARLRWAFSTILLVASIACAEPPKGNESVAVEPTRTVLWISIDGVRPDYIDRGETPTLDRLMREGAFTRDLVPVFPSLTFPSHVSLATGTKVREHGITGNSFIDISRTRPGRSVRPFRYPPWAEMLEAEPIWLTAARQQIRTASIDWPLSHSQRGDVTTEYFGEQYEGRLTDRERIMALLGIWETDEKRGESEGPLRLLMGYIVGPDSTGHQYGPDAPEPVEKLAEADRLLGEVVERAVALWKRDWKDHENAEFWVILTTDHGMSAVETLVHMGYLAGVEEAEDIAMVTSGNTGHIFFTEDREVEENDPERVQAILDAVNKHEFAKAYRRNELPKQWAYDHPTRTGDIVVILEKGYTFNRRAEAVTAPAKDHGGPLGMHGYDPVTNPEMNGIMIAWRHDKPLGGRNLGKVQALQMHATVAKLLGIEPAEKARKDAVDLVSERSVRSFKGWELYCWQDAEADEGWAFALLPGTNRLKHEEEIRRSPLRCMSEVRAALAKIAKGEMVLGMARCPVEKRALIEQMCAELDLSVQ